MGQIPRSIERISSLELIRQKSFSAIKNLAFDSD